jgi:hypothetical protein
MVHPEALPEVWTKYKELIKDHPETFAQPDGVIVLWKYAIKMTHIQAGIDTIRLLQEYII